MPCGLKPSSSDFSKFHLYVCLYLYFTSIKHYHITFWTYCNTTNTEPVTNANTNIIGIEYRKLKNIELKLRSLKWNVGLKKQSPSATIKHYHFTFRSYCNTKTNMGPVTNPNTNTLGIDYRKPEKNELKFQKITKMKWWWCLKIQSPFPAYSHRSAVRCPHWFDRLHKHQ